MSGENILRGGGPMRVGTDLAGEQGYEQQEMHRSQENIVTTGQRDNTVSWALRRRTDAAIAGSLTSSHELETFLLSVSTFLPRCNKNARRQDPCKCHLAAGCDVRRLVLRLAVRRGLKPRAGGVPRVSPILKSISGGKKLPGLIMAEKV